MSKTRSRREIAQEASSEFAFWNGGARPAPKKEGEPSLEGELRESLARKAPGRAPSPTRAVRVRIQNVMGLEEVEFDLGDVTEIKADNGCGKSSALEAISGLFQVSDSSRLLRRGADNGSIWMLFDDGSSVTRTIEPGGTELEAFGPDGRKLPSARAFLDKIANLASLRPADFLAANDAERINLLLKAVPLKLSPEFKEWARAKLNGLIKPSDLEQHAVLAVARLEEVARNERTLVGRDVKRKEAAEKELRDTLPSPEEMQTDWGRKVVELQSELSQANMRRQAKIHEMDKILMEEVADAETEYQAALSAARQARDRRVNEARQITAEQKTLLEQRHHQDTATVASELAVASDRLTQKQNAEAQYRVADRMTRELAATQARLAELEQALAELAAEKQRMLSRLPVSGLEISGGRLYRNGIPFDDLNTAQQIEIVLELAELVAGRVPIILADGMERLTPPRRQALIEAAVGKGMQFVFATATPNLPFSVETRGAA